MDQYQIHILKTRLLETAIHLRFCGRIAQTLGRDLTSEEEVFTCNPRLLDSGATRCFIVICGGGVYLDYVTTCTVKWWGIYMSIPGFEGMGYYLFTFCGRSEWKLVKVGELDIVCIRLVHL
jgi:hypothetical protein